MRSKTMVVHPIGEQIYRFSARLTDVSVSGDYGAPSTAPCGDGEEHTIHDFAVAGVIEGPELVVAEISPEAVTHPYRQCPAILPSCQGLVGRSLAKHWRGAVLDTFRATAGCTHVTTLLLGLAEARTMVIFLRMNALIPYSDITREDGSWTATGLYVAPGIEGACHVLGSSAPVVEAARTIPINPSPDDQRKR
jgi:hypothetical protein